VNAPVGPEQITAAAIASFDGCPDPRVRAILQALTRHLHALVTEMRLTQGEWSQAIEALTQSGEITNEHRQEFVLWSDVLGLSMLVDANATDRSAGATESTVIGPFWADGSPLREYGARISEQPGGDPVWVHGRVLGVDGGPIAQAELDVWQNGVNRLYAVQDPEAPEDHLRGRFLTRPDGSYAFLAVRPTPYPIPADGPVGRMLKATDRHPWRPAHIHVAVSAEGYEPLATHIFDAESKYLDSDAVFAVKPSLVRRFVRRSACDPKCPPGVSGEWFSVEMDLVLADRHEGGG
jgi:hydroxyquinol 1,2-dioxygenase